MAQLTSNLICAGCGWHAPATNPLPFRCARAESGDDRDHVLRRVLEAGDGDIRRKALRMFRDDDPHSFLRYRELFHSCRVATAGGIGDREQIELIRRLDAAVARVAGRGFTETSFAPSAGLSRRLGLSSGGLWVKDETGNVSGSHKARHMLGLLLSLEVARRLNLPQGAPDRPLAVSSCGNGALAAAVVADAVGRDLEVFVPPTAEPEVIESLSRHGARLQICERLGEEAGDPCYLRFREAVARGRLPFTCQGSENGLVIEGGQTLVWEMISKLLREGGELDHLFVQVGGGALASACVQGLREARSLGVIERLPRIHTVQTAGAWPLRRAWDRVVRRACPEADLSDRSALARRLSTAEDERVAGALRHASGHRSEYMRPWETEPRSIAHGILDDETYDWLLVVEGMLETGGQPLVASEESLREAWDLGRGETGIPVEPTGTAGLAGCLELLRRGEIGARETVAVLFTGVERRPAQAQR